MRLVDRGPMYRFYESPLTLDKALRLKAEHGAAARILAGGTDLLIELDRGVHKTEDGSAPGVIDLTRILGLAEIGERDGWIHLGPLVTHNQCVASPLLVEKAFPLVRACWEVGAPQIRNRGTLAGNLITASPANDTITPLLALDATVTVRSAARGDRHMALDRFFLGFRQVDLRPDEILVRISFRAMTPQQEGVFIKLGLRRAQAISILNAAVLVQFSTTDDAPAVKLARIALGAVAPTVVRAKLAEDFLRDQALTEEAISAAARLAAQAANPIDDIRSSADYRRAMVETLVARALRQIATGQARTNWSDQPVMLWGAADGKWPVATHSQVTNHKSQVTMVNGHPTQLPGHMTLLDSLRAAGLVGVKEGCAEGECGACTVFLDGIAVMACMVPSERAAGSAVTTVEGLRQGDQLHRVQEALVQSGGVQCGYCTPGFVMSAAKLLEERPHPTPSEAAEALTGNLCRCTGYRKILDAVVAAGSQTEA